MAHNPTMLLDDLFDLQDRAIQLAVQAEVDLEDDLMLAEMLEAEHQATIADLERHLDTTRPINPSPEWLAADTQARHAAEREASLKTMDGLRRKIAPRENGDAIAPGILSRTDGWPLFYAQEVNWCYGKPAGGKTWLALCAVIEAVKMGGRVAIFDSEDKPWKTHLRATALGQAYLLEDEDFVAYFDNDAWGDLATDAREDIIEWLLEADRPVYSFVLVDSAGSSGAPSDGGSIREWLARCVKPFYNRFLGVLVIDHTTKNKPQDDDAKGPIGTQDKLMAITGAGMLVDGRPWTTKKNGSIRLTCEKDRNGIWQEKATVALIRGEYHQPADDKVLVLSIEAHPDEGKIDATADPEALENWLLQVIARHPRGGRHGYSPVVEVVGHHVKGWQPRLADNQGERLGKGGRDRAQEDAPPDHYGLGQGPSHGNRK